MAVEVEVKDGAAESVTRMANAVKAAIMNEVSDHHRGWEGTDTNSVVGTALIMVILDISTNIDPLLRAGVVVGLGGTLFAQN